MKEKLQKIMEEAVAQITASETMEKLNEIKVAYLGKKGELTSVLKSMKDVPAEERPMVGQLVNDARQTIEAAFDEKRETLAKAALELKLQNETIGNKRAVNG